jgi:hypothetical protein
LYKITTLRFLAAPSFRLLVESRERGKQGASQPDTALAARWPVNHKNC